MVKDGFRFHHIGVATDDVQAAGEPYRALGYELGETVDDPLQKVRVRFATHAFNPTVELVAPLGEDSPVSVTLKKSRATPYHTCYEVERIEDALVKLRGSGFLLVSGPMPAVAFNGRGIAFFYSREIGLIELLDKG